MPAEVDDKRCRVKALGAESRVNCQEDGKKTMKARAKAVHSNLPGRAWPIGVLAASLVAAAASAQTFPNLPITPGQRATAQQVAQAGVPLSELSPNAPDSYTVKRGDTLWGISGLFLRSPWRWPELWGMNMDQVRNPHLIFPGQHLVLEKADGRARLRLAQPGDGLPPETVRLSPQVRATPLGDAALPTIAPHLIEPFLAEPLIVDAGVLEAAPRIVATPESRVLITRGDRAYARSSNGTPMATGPTPEANQFRVVRSAKALVHPVTRAVLGYEAQFLGRAELVRGEGVQTVTGADGRQQSLPIPATLDIVSAREEIRTGDRLLPEPPRQFQSYAPRVPRVPIDGAVVVSMYGDSVRLAGQNQIVVINKGTADGIEVGHVMAIVSDGRQQQDRTRPGVRETIQLPDERNGLLMVFRPFEKLSYALVLETSEGVGVGNRLVAPR